MPLKDNPAKGIKGFEIPDFLDRIIIGPTEHPVATYNALLKAMAAAGIAEPTKKLFISGVPLRPRR